MWWSRFFKYSGYYSNWAKAEWISPVGEVFDTEGDTHQGWMFKNQEYLDGEHNIFTDMMDEMREEQDSYVYKNIERIKKEISEYENDPEEQDYVNKQRKELEYWENELGSVDYIDMNVPRLVNNLIFCGWVRKVDKGGNIHYEFGDDNSLRIIENDIFNNMQSGKRMNERTPIMLEDLRGGVTLMLYLGDLLKSGMNLREWIDSEPGQITYDRLRDR